MIEKSKQILTTIFVALIAALPQACIDHSGAPESSSTSGLAGIHGGNLIVSVSSDPVTFNRMLTSGLANALITNRLSGDLVHINRATLELEPSLASNWELGEDDRSYTIHLRTGLKFSDGSPFTADDVIFTFRALQDSRQAVQVLVDGIFPTVEKIDKLSVRLTFPRPFGMGLRALDSIPMLPRHILEQAYREGTYSSAWGPAVDPQVVVGMGPFRLREYRRGESVILERNPHYWNKDQAGRQLPYLDNITFLIIPDRNTRALRFQAGELDLVYELNPDNYATLRRYQQEKGFTLQNLGSGLGMDFLWFNLNLRPGTPGKSYVDPEKRAVFEKAEFRRAVSHALDRVGMAQSVFFGLGEPQYGPITTGNKIWYSERISLTELNPIHSRELLTGIGLVDTDGDGILEYGAGSRPLEISLITTPGHLARERMAEVIKDNLHNIGVRVNIQLLLANEIAVRITNSFDYEAILFGITPTDIAPDLQMDLWHSSGQHHLWHPGQLRPQRRWEAEIDNLISSLVQDLDSQSRRESFNRIQEIWVREMPAIPTVAPNILVAWKNNIGNIKPSILVPHLLWNVEEITKESPGSNQR